MTAQHANEAKASKFNVPAPRRSVLSAASLDEPKISRSWAATDAFFLEDPILPRKYAALLIGVSETTFWRLAEFDPSFVPKIRLSARRVGWRKSDLEQWLSSREGA